MSTEGGNGWDLNQVDMPRNPMAHAQVQEILRAGTTDGVHGAERPLILMIIRGARSGRLRFTPVMRVEHEGRYAVIGSMGGQPNHPAWYFNLKAHPDLLVQDGTTPRPFTAHEASGEERDVWWQRAAAAYPNYDAMQRSTARVLPLFVLDPI